MKDLKINSDFKPSFFNEAKWIVILTKRNVLAIVVILLLSAEVIFPQQTTSSLQVKVTDQNDDLIPAVVARLKKDEKIIKEITSENAQETVFAKLADGKYLLEVEASGFKPQSLEVEIKTGKNELTFILEIAEAVENVKVASDAQESATENAFSNFLTDEQIAALPDDPAEMKRVLKQMAGGGDVVIRVDGFSGAELPAKSQIASIRIVRSSYDAENHELGFVYVDVLTKVGSRRFSGSLFFNFSDEALNTRNPFADRRFPEQNRYTFFNLSGPIVENKTDFSLLFSDTRNFQAQNIVAFLPDGAFNNSVNSQADGTSLNLRINHNLTKSLPIKLNYRFSNGNSKNLGVGGFNLPDKAFDTKNRSHEFRFSTVGTFAKRFLDEFRLQYKNETSITIPLNSETAITVLDSFSRGGAGNFQQNSRQSFWLANNLLFGTRQHALKIGGTVFIENEKQVSAFNQNGTFIFSTLQDFVLGRPSIFSQSQGTRNAEVLQYQIGTFVQDDFRIGKSFIASFGVRYERQNNLRDKDNFSPRIGFSWTPFKDGKTTFRGGIGLFYNWLETRNLLTIRSQDRTQSGETIIFNPSYPNPFLGGASQILSPSFTQKADDLKNPYIVHTSFGVQRRISANTSFRAEYIYQKGVHQFRSRDINAPLEGIRPNPNFGKISQVESSAFFVRNSLNVGFNGSLTKTISYTLDYTLAKIISDSDGIFGLPSENYNLRNDISAANNDQRHRLNAYLSWQIRKDLRLSGIYTVNSSLPYTITTGRDDNRDTTFNDRPFGLKRNGERGAWHNQLDLNLSYIFSFINRKGGKSNKGYSIVTTSAESGFDFTDPEKRFSLRFFANAENILNQTNLNNFVGVQTSPFFRQATFADQSRKITFGLRFNF